MRLTNPCAPLQVPTAYIPWPKDGLRRASVNCFGFGGTNAHVILDDAGSYLAQRGLAGTHRSVPTNVVQAPKHKAFNSTHVFLISGHEKEVVWSIADGHASYIKKNGDADDLLPDYSYTLSRRSALEYKTAIVAQDPAELAAKLANHQELGIHRCIADESGTPRLALVFCGQGAQWHAMGRELLEYKAFSSSIVSASRFMATIDRENFDLFAELTRYDPSSSWINEPRFAQPATTAIQIALVDLLKAANVNADAVVGHSSGEIAAAYAAGHISQKDAWLIAFKRGKHATSLEILFPGLKGCMMAVGLSADDAKVYISKLRRDTVVVACENSPVSVTLSGDEKQILELKDMFTNDGVFHKLLAVKIAYHSAHMHHVEAAYHESIATIAPKSSDDGPVMYSSVTGQVVDGASLDASYWAQNLVSPVLFNTAFTNMFKAIKPKLVLEASPSVVLNRPIQEIIKGLIPKKNKAVPCISLLKRNIHASITTLEALGELWAHGSSVDFNFTMKSREGHLAQLLVDLPPYPFNHSKPYWFESHLGTNLRFRKHGREDLIGAPLAESTPQEPRWRGFFRIEENPWLVDHQVQKTIIYPASGLITMALEAARQCIDSTLVVDVFQISNLKIAKPVIIPVGQHGLEHMLNAKMIRTISPDTTKGSTVYSFSILTRTENGQWQENADGQFSIFYDGKTANQPAQVVMMDTDLANTHRVLEHQCKQYVNPRQLYERLDGIGMNYGSLFKNITSLSKCESACISVVRIPDTRAKMPAQFEFDHLIHPATLDTMFQTVFAIGGASMVPSFIRSISFSPKMLKGAGAEFHGYATAKFKGLREAQADITMSDENFSKAMVAVKGMEFVKISSDASGFLPSNRHLCSEMTWQELGPVSAYNYSTDFVNDGAPVMLLIPDGPLSEFTKSLIHQLMLPNFECVYLSELSEEFMAMPCISLLEAEQAMLFEITPQVFSQLKKLLMATTGLLWVTKGGQMPAADPTMAPFIGLARTIRSEDSSKRIASLDLDPTCDSNDLITCVSAIHSAFNWSCVQPEFGEIAEVEYSLQTGKLYTARLTPLNALNNVIEKGQDEAFQIEKRSLIDLKSSIALKLGHTTEKGAHYFVDDDKFTIRPLAPTEVQIQVDSTNLFPIDVETIQGKGNMKVVGADFVGRVMAVGSRVRDLHPNCLVTGLARDTLRTTIIVDRSVIHRPQNRSKLWGLSPTALTTAYYTLENLGHVSEGDTVFVNQAAGPYGDAAMTIAIARGATVYAGVSSEEERNFILQNYNVQYDHTIDTSNDRFPEEVMNLTGEAGVDFFFSPTPDRLDMCAQCVTTNGHLALILNTNSGASRSVSIPHHLDFSFHKFDLYAILEKRPKLITKAWNEAYAMLSRGELGYRPLDLVREERIEHLGQVWQSMAATPGRYLNTVTFTDSSVLHYGHNPLKQAKLNPKATYVLVGGLGGLGKAIADLMVMRGARNLLFLSRSGAKTMEDVEYIESLINYGCQVRCLAIDACDTNALKRVLDDRKMPPIKGVVQCAAVIADAVFETMTYEEWVAATRPKMTGSMNLHKMLPRDMDFFIFLSSASGVIGNRGQANYAAGNCFQDALARHRSALGLRNSVSIDLGPVLGAGMLENDEKTLAILKASGFFMVELDNLLFLVERILSGEQGSGRLRLPPQVITGVGTGGLILQNEVADPFWAETRMFDVLNRIDAPGEGSDGGSSSSGRSATPGSSSSVASSSAGSSVSSGRSLAHALKQADSLDEACDAILRGCVDYLAVSLGMSADDMDTDKSLTAYGVDSLVTSSLRNWVYKNVGVKLTDLEVLGTGSIAELAQTIAGKGSWGQ